jgi:acyl dehydratase
VKYFEDCVIDERIIFPGRYELTEQNIVLMGQEWDPQPFHTDPKAAESTIFGGLVASTVHLFAIATKLSHTATEKWAAVSSLGISEMKNHSPGYVGDIIECHNTFTDKRISRSRPKLGVLSYHSQLFNQDQKILFEFSGAALYQMRKVVQKDDT